MSDSQPKVRCPCCHRLLFVGELRGVIRCGKCGTDLYINGQEIKLDKSTLKA
ncbi:MAG: hypothetical protein HY323_09135 [Betaproteobacteria bacterium]|nr:hypothetical protein [Betaproteobacteria bacterium]